MVSTWLADCKSWSRLKELIEAQRVLDYIMKLTEGYTMKLELSLGTTVEGEGRMKECEVRG